MAARDVAPRFGTACFASAAIPHSHRNVASPLQKTACTASIAFSTVDSIAVPPPTTGKLGCVCTARMAKPRAGAQPAAIVGRRTRNIRSAWGLVPSTVGTRWLLEDGTRTRAVGAGHNKRNNKKGDACSVEEKHREDGDAGEQRYAGGRRGVRWGGYQ
jgi:hypothetical protein